MALLAKQKAFIDAYCENPIVSMASLAESMGIPANTVYGWNSKNLHGFHDELEQRLKDKWAEAKHMASETMFSLAREGDFKAAKYILDYAGYAPTEKIEANVTNSINITIGDDDGPN